MILEVSEMMPAELLHAALLQPHRTQINPSVDRGRKNPTSRPFLWEIIHRHAIEVLLNSPNGIRHSKLIRAIIDRDPSLNKSTVSSCTCNLQKTYPQLICKPERGLFMHVGFRDNFVRTESHGGQETQPARITEHAFYPALANWLTSVLKETTGNPPAKPAQ